MKDNLLPLPDYPSWLALSPDVAKPDRAAAANLIDSLLDSIDANLELWARLPGDPDTAYDLLAAWGKTQRLNLQLIVDPQDLKLVEILHDLIRDDGERLRRTAAVVPNPDAWLEAASHLEADIQNQNALTPEVIESQVRTLLEDLDDAELVAWALRNASGEDSQLDEGLERCRAWTSEHAEVFISASGFAAAVAGTVKADLPDADSDLVLTVLKFAGVLDETATALAFATFDGIEPIPSDMRRVLRTELAAPHAEPSILERLRMMVRQFGPAVKNYVTFPLPIPAYEPIVAAGDAIGRQAQGRKLTWRGLQQQWSAFMRLPPERDASDSALVTLWINDIVNVDAVILNGRMFQVQQSEYYLTVRFELGLLRRIASTSDLPTLALLLGNGKITIGRIEDA